MDSITTVKSRSAYLEMLSEAKSPKDELSDMSIESQRSVLWGLIGYYGKDSKFQNALKKMVEMYK